MKELIDDYILASMEVHSAPQNDNASQLFGNEESFYAQTEPETLQSQPTALNQVL